MTGGMHLHGVTDPIAPESGKEPPNAGWHAPIVVRHVADDVIDRLVTAVALGLYVPGQQLRMRVAEAVGTGSRMG